LRDRDDPATIEYLEAENAYSEEWFAPHAALREEIFQEIKSRVQETDEGVPARRGDWWYVSRTVEGKSYTIHCRGRSAETATDTVMLDENVEAEGQEYFHLGTLDVSQSQRLVAWARDLDGGEEYELRIRDLDSGTDLTDCMKRTYYGSAWSTDDAWIFYTVPDEAMRPYQVWRHRIGTEQGDDVLVHEENDERFSVDLSLTRSGEWVVITSNSISSTEVWLVPAAQPESLPELVRAREPDHEYNVDHWNDRFVILTNLDAEDFRVVTAPIETPDRWTDLVPHQPGRRIAAVEPFDGHLVLQEWAQAQPGLRILFPDGTERAVDLGDDPSDVELSPNPDYHTSVVRYEYQSLVTPRSVYDEDVRTGDRVLLKQTPVLGVDLSAYATERTWATAPDGTKLPVDVVYKKGTPRDGTAPGVLYGYGSYEISMAPWFAITRLSLLDRGFVWALAHPRGGGELGRRWYLDGKFLKKRNTFTDFIASAEHLIAQRYVAPHRLAIQGGSAGGLLVGASVTMRPDLFAAVVAEVPFVDVVSTMSDPSLPLTAGEWEEWGDPRAEPYASYMLSYSPYDNTAPAAYPAMYITAGLNDPRVSYHEPSKWVAKLRAVNQSERPIVYKIEMGAGHGGPSGRYDLWRDTAQTMSFLLNEV
jgi:oligopeptidase B